MADVLVLGAGVIGVTTAWWLNQAGFDVTVIDRQPSVALETSKANGGQLSVSHAEPWANPHAPAQLVKWLIQPHSPLRFQPSLDAGLYRWGLQFLKECSSNRSKHNIKQLINLGLYSRQAMYELLQKQTLNFHLNHGGILHFYTSLTEFENAKDAATTMRRFGCNRQTLSASDAVLLEPALAGIKLVGATYTVDDASGNAFEFTNQLALLCRQQGVKFLFDTSVDQINIKNDKASSISVKATKANQTDFKLSAQYMVLCLGSYSSKLAKTAGLDLLIQPAKGYSATYRVLDPANVPKISLTDDEYKLVFSRYKDEVQDVLRVAGMAELIGFDDALNFNRAELITRRIRSLFGNALDYTKPNYWAGLRPSTPSNVPYLGQSIIKNLWLNTGHGTLGFTHACGSAKALSLLMQGETPALDFEFSR